jgi:hypothetical protein
MPSDSETRRELEAALRDVLGPLGRLDDKSESSPGSSILAGVGGLFAGFLVGRFTKKKRSRRSSKKK